MGRRRYERLSQRQYADRLGISNTIVSKAVKGGLIKKGWDSKEKKIIVEHADREWGDIIRKTQKENVVTLVQSSNESEQGKGEKTKLGVKADADPYEANRVLLIAKAQLALVELAEKKGQLADKNLVNKQLREIGSEIRKAFEHLPERVIDHIRAAETRNEGISIIKNEIRDILTRLANTIDQSANN